MLGAPRGYLGVGKFEQSPAGSGEEPSAGELPHRGFAEAASSSRGSGSSLDLAQTLALRLVTGQD